jgi:uncharacterized protein DUF4124
MERLSLLCRLAALAVLLAGLPAAHADLYRWLDPASGSVKLSNYPPPAGRPAEVVPYQGQAAAVAPASVLAGSAAARPAASALEQRWRTLLQGIAALPPDTDLRTAGAGLRRQLEAYQALAAELDRVDPAGASRRHEEQAGLFERLRKGLQTQLNPASPVQQ